MKLLYPIPFLLSLTTLLTLLPQATAYWRGFNIKSNLASGTGTCKSPSSYLTLFRTLKTFPNSINSVRLYSSHTCTTLLSAVPAALSTQTYILVGIDAHLANFENEKGALKQAVQKYGWGWMLGVSVGSEDLYRGTITPGDLAERIYDVRGMLRGLEGYTAEKKVGHVDTTNAWFNVSNAAVIRASEFVGTDIYPYFQATQNNSIANAATLFFDGVKQAKEAVARAGGGASVWVTETGWPVNGATRGLAVPGVENARRYWREVACAVFAKEGVVGGKGVNTWWFTGQDWRAVPSFAVLGEEGERLYDLSC